MNKLKKILKDPARVLMFLSSRRILRIEDKKYLSLLFRLRMKEKLNWDNPKTYSEKLQWLKIYDRNPLYIKLVDKYEVKKYVSEKIGEEYIIPTLGDWNNANEIDYERLPNQFVLKCTHDSGGLFIVTNKEKTDCKRINKKLNKCLKHNFYYGKREWPYKDVKPRIIAEKYMIDNKSNELKDYKFFCFDGIPRYMYIARDRNNVAETKFDFYDMNFEHIDLTNGHPNSDSINQKPENFEKMKELASKLSKSIPQVRVDFYEANGKVYFGEMTFFHMSGLVPFNPPEWDEKFGKCIDLSKINRKRK